MNSSQLANLLELVNKLQIHHGKLNLNDHDDDGHDDHNHDHDHNTNDNDDNNSLIIAKATAMVVLFCASTLCGCIPFILNRYFKWTDTKESPKSAIIVKCLLYFGGGVLLCTTFLHLLPEVNENIEELQNDKIIPEISFNLGELLMCLGFFLMYFIEEIIHVYINKQNNKNLEQIAFERGRSIRNSYLLKNQTTTTTTTTKTNNNNNNNDNDDNNRDDNDDVNDNDEIQANSRLSVKDLLTNDIENQKYQEQQNDNDDHHQQQQHQHNQHNDKQLKTIDNHHHNHHNHTHNHHGHSHNLPTTTTNLNENTIVTSLRGLLIVLALSLHELFEGLAVGLESETKNVWYMFAAVSAHKLVLAFCVGVELIVTRTKLWLALIYVITFAIVSPIGIGIGILISNNNSTAAQIPSAILQGLATGTLLYVVFFEILSKERSGLIAYLAFVIGFAVMFGLQFSTGHEHTHSHGGHDEHDDHVDHNDHEHEHHTKNLAEQIKLLHVATKEFL